MIKNILNVNDVKVLTKVEQFDILGGNDSVVKIVCSGGNLVSGDAPNCHCHNLGDGIYLVQYTNDGTDSYRTINMLGKVVEEL
ncbi:hypothetical protein [Kordia sp.]|uniref:hypothetical protein n=1 Tax=Kordia sp. TaxID=1965332 RepID=UPI003B58B574